MHWEMRSRKLFGVAATLWMLLVFIAFLKSASAAPQLSNRTLFRRAGEPPGIGVEIEISGIQPRPNRVPTAEEREKIKGAIMTPVGYTGEPKTNWELTAELGTSTIYVEAIVDGLKNKVGHRKTGLIGDEILDYVEQWAPCHSSQSEVKVKGFDYLGPWKIRWPDNPLNTDQYIFNPQVTTAMPLEAVLQILSDSKDKISNPLATKADLSKLLKIISKTDFTSFTKIKADDITDEFLGFFSLLTSYCSLSEQGNPAEGPKRIVSVMPRTDFLFLYTRFIKPKLKDQLADGTVTLSDIIEKISGEGAGIRNKEFKWYTRVITTEIAEDWIGKEEDIQTGRLRVGKFLDYLQGYDKSTKKPLPQMDLLKLMDKTKRHGQIGSLGDKMETVLYTSELAPIFEFRDLNGIPARRLGTVMASYEEKVIEYHEQFAKRRMPWKWD